MRTRRCDDSARRLHYRHRIFDRDLAQFAIWRKIHFRACKAWQNESITTLHKMSSIQLGGYTDCEVEPAESVAGKRSIRRCSDEITAEADEGLGLTPLNRIERVHYIVTAITRWIEAEDLLQLIQKFLAGPLGDAHSAIALHVRVSSHRDDARARSADVPVQE